MFVGKRDKPVIAVTSPGAYACSLSRKVSLLATLLAGICLGMWLGAWTPAADAEATIAPSSIAGSAGLPNGRVYEEVSPADKNGNVAGYEFFANGQRYPGAAAASGEAVVFSASGPIGETPSGFAPASMYVARHSGHGWSTSAATPRPTVPGPENLTDGPATASLLPSANFSSFAFTAYNQVVSEEPAGPDSSVNIFLTRNPFEAPTWVGKPESDADVIPQTGFNDLQTPWDQDYFVMGGTTDLSTLYFTYSGTLLAQDDARAANVGDGQSHTPTDPWGFYEWHDGKLGEAGVLPDGSVSQYGAVAAAIAGTSDDERYGYGYVPPYQPEGLDNEISSDGTRAFFVSPDPVSGPSAGPPELYAREQMPDGPARTVLVSRDTLLPSVAGLPASAPDGPVGINNAVFLEPYNKIPDGSSFVYASPDGSQAFFASADALTHEALEAEEGGLSKGALKEYDFNLDTETLTYLPGVGGAQILASASDGSRFVFLLGDQIELWSSAPAGGQITSITTITPSADTRGVVGRAATDGSAFVFQTDAAVPGFNDGSHLERIPGGEFQQVANRQIYHYDVASGTLACVSCTPAGVSATGDANLSYNEHGGSSGVNLLMTVDTRALSANGGEVFFDSPDPLVPQDTNGERDVYEWENGHVYLISSGKSTEDSTFLDSSASGEDVFFLTGEGLVSGDVDGTYDVYDARVPRPGDSPPALPSPCEGDVCQGPPSVPTPLAAPASVTFYGLGNPAAPVPPVASKVTKKKHTTANKSKKRKSGKKPKRKATKSAKRKHGGKS